MYCFLLSTYHYFLGIDIVGMEFLYMMTWSWSWSCWLADCKKNCGWIAWATAGCWLDASLLLYALFLFTSCTHDNTSTEWNTISLSRLDYLHFLWKICSCVVYQCIFWSNIHYVYLYSASQALLDYFVVLHYYSSLGLCYCLYLMWLL